MSDMATTLARRWARLPEASRAEIDAYETELHRYLSGQVVEKVFTEYRLRFGTYGQRQPATQMSRIKIPLGILDARQAEALADLAEEYSDRIIHITTRQDVQFHFVEIRDTPNLFRRLAEVGITTREACGNTVRNVTACPYSGICADEVFDVTPYARAMAYFLLRHPDAQGFGRKFKVAFSGCAQHACGLARMHDIGAVAKVRREGGQEVHGFEVWVGGGLGAVPHQARLFSEFVPASELLPLAQSIARVFAALGEKKSRARARMKFLVEQLGIDKFRETVLEERKKLKDDPRWAGYRDEALAHADRPARPAADAPRLPAGLSPADLAAFQRWHRANVRPQKSPGHSAVEIYLPLGDLTSAQLRGVAALVRKWSGGILRTTVSQNLLLRHVSNADLFDLYRGLEALRLALPLAGSIADITACPGTDSCKLGIASSRGLAAVLLEEHLGSLEAANGITAADGTPRKDVSIKISGCFNSCGQHHIANIGFFGTSKRQGKRVAPLFQVILGGTHENNADAYGLMVAKVAAHRAPEVVRKLTGIYDTEKESGESFNACMARLGKARINAELAEFGVIGEEEGFYHDNRQPWQYVKDVGMGECAGEVVTQAEFGLQDSERLVFEATLALDAGKPGEAGALAWKAMTAAADALLSTEGLLISDRYDTVLEFRKRFIEAGRIFAGIADYFLKAAAETPEASSPERARKLVEEANLFVEEAHVVYGRMAGSTTK